jgi:hypothetical protein
VLARPILGVATTPCWDAELDGFVEQMLVTGVPWLVISVGEDERPDLRAPA